MIEFSTLLPLSPEAAFDTFTQRISEWWPPTHRLSADPSSAIVISPDGAFHERTTDGRTVALGHVRLWSRPLRIELDFYLGTGPEQPTDVLVTFESVESGTRVTVQHRPLPVSAALWDSRVARYQQSWPSVLGALESFARSIDAR